MRVKYEKKLKSNTEPRPSNVTNTTVTVKMA